jgi:Na+/H+-dicarboxylate symporter
MASIAAQILRHPVTLAIALVLGAAWGGYASGGVEWMSALGGAYMALLNMAATPLIVVAVFFGLRRVLALPRPGVRLLALFIGGIAAMLLCATLAAVLAHLWGAGSGLTGRDTAALGELTLSSEGVASISLYQDSPEPASTLFARPVPGNFYHALAYEPLPAVLIGALLFGFALATQKGEQSRHLVGQLEGIYRALETVIERLNTLLPLVAFALAATVVAATGVGWLQLMRGFLGPFLLVVAMVALACAALAARHVGTSTSAVLQALRRPMTVSLFAGGPAAAVPSLIDGLCNQLGFRRDLVEFAAPVVPAFLRAGEAVFFAVLAVFVANLYGRHLEALDLAVICLLATGAALASVAASGGRSLVAGTAMLGYLGLPLEALLPAFVLLEVACEGPRNLLSLLLAAALVALVSRGLAWEQPVAAPRSPDARWRVVLPRRQAIAAGTLLAVALFTAALAGVGLGLRQAEVRPAAPAATVSPGVTR